MEKTIFHNDGKFGRLLNKGDTVRLTNLVTGETDTWTVARFDGIEYVFENGQKLGHSGYTVEEHGFNICMNTEPFIKVELVKPRYVVHLGKTKLYAADASELDRAVKVPLKGKEYHITVKFMTEAEFRKIEEIPATPDSNGQAVLKL